MGGRIDAHRYILIEDAFKVGSKPMQDGVFLYIECGLTISRIVHIEVRMAWWILEFVIRVLKIPNGHRLSNFKYIEEFNDIRGF